MTTRLRFSAILACDQNMAIGHQNKIPWHLPEDLEFFKQTTKQGSGIMLMGANTFRSFPKPLPGRQHVVLSKRLESYDDNVHICHDRQAAWTKIKELAKATGESEVEIWIIGGSQIYSMLNDWISKWVVTHIINTGEEFPADCWLPEFVTRTLLHDSTMNGEVKQPDCDQPNMTAYRQVYYPRITSNKTFHI